MLGDLGEDVLIKDGLYQNHDSLGLVLDAELLRLDVDGNIINLLNAALFLDVLLNPGSELVVDSVSTALAILVLIIAVDSKLLLELARKLLSTGLDSFSTHIHSPVVIVHFDLLDIQILSLGLDLASQSVIVASDVAVLVLAGRSAVGIVVVSGPIVLVGLAILFGLAGSLAFSLVLLSLLGHVLQDEAAELIRGEDLGDTTAGLAVESDVAVVDVDIGLGVLAVLAEHKVLDKPIEQLLELASLVGAVDDPAVVGRINVGLGTQLEAEVLDEIGAGAGQRLGDTAEVDNNGLDTVALALNLGLDPLHLVAVEGIRVVPLNVDERHDCGIERLPG